MEVEKNTMTFNDLIRKHEWEEIEPVLIKLYEDVPIEGYKVVFSELKRLEPLPNDENLSILIKKEIDHFDGSEFIHVNGIQPDNKTTYGLSFSMWQNWLGYDIHRRSLNYSEVEIIAHCLWEMTWSGFTQEQIQLQNDELSKRLEDALSGKTKMIPWSEAKKSLEERIKNKKESL